MIFSYLYVWNSFYVFYIVQFKCFYLCIFGFCAVALRQIHNVNLCDCPNILQYSYLQQACRVTPYIGLQSSVPTVISKFQAYIKDFATILLSFSSWLHLIFTKILSYLAYLEYITKGS